MLFYFRNFHFFQSVNMKIFFLILICFLFLACSNEKNEPVVITKTDTVYLEKENNSKEQSFQSSYEEKNIKITEPRKEKKVEKKDEPAPNPYLNSKIEYKIVNSENGTFGYDIIIEGKTSIHQPSIPGMPGNNGFRTKEQAERTAKFVISKIRQNIMPPTVTIQELDSLKVLK